MKTKHTLAAFTLVEITISMLITAICMGIAFYILDSFNTINSNLQKEQQDNYKLQIFHQRMVKETRAAQHIILTTENKIQLLCHKTWTSYSFMNFGIIRSQQDIPTDTLLGIVNDFNVSYVANLPITLVKSYKFTLRYKDENKPFVLNKTYSAQELVELSDSTQ